MRPARRLRTRRRADRAPGFFHVIGGHDELEIHDHGDCGEACGGVEDVAGDGISGASCGEILLFLLIGGRVLRGGVIGVAAR